MISQELGRKENLSLALVGRDHLPASEGNGQPMRIKLGAAVLIAAALGGCATSFNNFVGDPFIQPAKFRYLRCPDIAKRLVTAQARETELHGLMDRANSSFGGSAVNVMVYGSDLRAVEAELRELHQTEGEKRCADEAIKAPPKPPDVAPPR
jgi:hypothetical protein